MQNDKGDYVDLYIPRRCFATNKLLDSKDHASVQVTLSTVRYIFIISSRSDYSNSRIAKLKMKKLLWSSQDLSELKVMLMLLSTNS